MRLAPFPASSFEAGDKDTPLALERRQASIKEGAILARISHQDTRNEI